MSVGPKRLECVTANKLKTGELKTLFVMTDERTRNVPEDIRLASARGAWTRAAQELEIEIRFLPIIPLNGQLVCDLLNVGRLQTHWNSKFTTIAMLKAILALGLSRS
jgi:hypothetical protein